MRLGTCLISYLMKRNFDMTCALVLMASIVLLGVGLAGSVLLPLLPFPHAEEVGLLANQVAFGAEVTLALSGVSLWIMRRPEWNSLGKYELHKFEWARSVVR